MQVIQEICDIKDDKYIQAADEGVQGKPLLLEQTTDPIAQREHNKYPKEDIGGMDGSGDVETCNNK